MVKRAGIVCTVGLVASYLLIGAAVAQLPSGEATATTTCQQCCPSANAWMTPAGTVVAAFVSGLIGLVVFFRGGALQKELEGIRKTAADHAKDVETMSAFNLSLTEYRRTQRATHLLKLFEATALPPQKASPSAAPPAQAQPLPPSPTDPTRRAWAEAVRDNLRAAYMEGAGLFLGYAKATYHRVRELLEGPGVEEVEASELEAATKRMLSVLRTALILEVDGLLDDKAQRDAKTTRDNFVGYTDGRPPAANLKYVAKVHRHLESQPASKRSCWPSLDDVPNPVR